MEDSRKCQNGEGHIRVFARQVSTQDKANVSHCDEKCYKPRLNNVFVPLLNDYVSLLLLGVVDTGNRIEALPLNGTHDYQDIFCVKVGLARKFSCCTSRS